MTEEDEAFEAIDKAQGWRKRQIEQQLGQPIYFKPRREWIGLTQEEIKGIELASGGSLFSAIMFTYEKVKEKNHD